MAKRSPKETSSKSQTSLAEDRIGEYPAVVLSDVAQILRAPLFKTETAKTGTDYRIVSVKDMDDEIYITSVDREIRLGTSAPRADKYRLEQFDVLMTMVGEIGAVRILAETPQEAWIPSSNFFVIRFRQDQQDYARLFRYFITSAYGTELLQKLKRGRSIDILSKKQFAQILIPELTSDLRKTIRSMATKEERLHEKRRQLLDEATAVTEGFLADVPVQELPA